MLPPFSVVATGVEQINLGKKRRKTSIICCLEAFYCGFGASLRLECRFCKDLGINIQVGGVYLDYLPLLQHRNMSMLIVVICKELRDLGVFLLQDRVPVLLGTEK